MRARPGGIRAASGWWGRLRALRVRDPGGTSLRRALRVAIVVPPMAAFAGTIVGNRGAATFAVFGAFALLGLADFGGPTIPRARAYAGAGLVGVGLVLLGTLASGNAWSAVAGTMLAAFMVQFLGVFGGYVVAAQTAVLLAFVVAVSIPAPAGAAWARVAGWALAGGISLAAGVLLWPRHARTQVRQRAGDACQALAAMLADARTPTPAADQARARVEATHQAYDQAPLRPDALARPYRAVLDLVIQLDRAHEFASRTTRAGRRHVTVPEERRLLRTIGQVLEASAGILRGGAGGPGQASAGPGQASGGAGQASAGPDLAALDRDRVAYRK